MIPGAVFMTVMLFAGAIGANGAFCGAEQVLEMPGDEPVRIDLTDNKPMELLKPVESAPPSPDVPTTPNDPSAEPRFDDPSDTKKKDDTPATPITKIPIIYSGKPSGVFHS